MKAGGGTAVMAGRHEPPDSLDFFPTPPWATRALCEHVLPWFGCERRGTVWEPACGEGHMAEPLGEYFESVRATDIFPYGYGEQEDFLAGPLLAAESDAAAGDCPDWIITNPPFNRAAEFALAALRRAGRGVALLVRNQWIEGAERYRRLFQPHPPTAVAPFVERVPMVKGRWDPAATTATAYSWFVWYGRPPWPGTQVLWIPPGCRQRLTRPDDRRRFAAWAAVDPSGDLGGESGGEGEAP